MSQELVTNADLDSIINGSDAYPAAKLAATMLRPLLKQATSELANSGKHADGVRPTYSHMPQETLASVNKTVAQLQTQMFDLQKLAFQYPDQKDDILKQYDEIKNVAATLGKAVAAIYELNDITHGRGAGAARA